MIKKPVTIFLLVLFTRLLSAQSQESLLFFPIQEGHLKTRASARKILSQQGISFDSLLQSINARIAENLAKQLPGINITVMDTGTIKSVFDSSRISQEFTSAYAKKVASAKGIKRVIMFNRPGFKVRYGSRILAVAGTLKLQQELLNRNGAYYLFLNKTILRNSNKSKGFTLHFELYDKNFQLISGDKYYHFLDLEPDLFYSAFNYYLDNCIRGFSGKLAFTVTDSEKR